LSETIAKFLQLRISKISELYVKFVFAQYLIR